MNIFAQREPSIPSSTGEGTTLSVCFVDDVFFAFGLEDEIREVPNTPVSAWKIDKRTAIPSGRYRVRMTYSPRFGRQMPEVLGVPGFDGIRLHPLNTSRDTEGCYGLGLARAGAAIQQSTSATGELEKRIIAAEARGEEVWIEFRNPPSWYRQHGLTQGAH